ncbi:MAG: hypothetical protein KGJ09_09405 [Candidatus Omnitrophica bacterium]|nr:hypothetical protein [Candidatus Omnitrophota bacterium]MDE2010276.1 hypothetical protein [Candidatus Omnitrophota bacterium]MDE2215235.1 hypothetical protein [Candidatus Omnitrophota bacterium]
MGKKRKDEHEDEETLNQLRVYRGVFPWSVAEHDWVIATFNLRRPNGIEGLPIPEEYPELEHDLKTVKGQELENIKDIILFSDIFRHRYPKKLEYESHSYRFNQINKFLDIHYDELVQMRFVVERDGEIIVAPQLIETLCTSLYDEEDFDESGEWIGNTFSFKDVVAETKAKIDKKAAKDRPTEDQARKGLIPWSSAEFKWVMNEQSIRRQNSDENEKLQEEYLPLKIQMARETGKKISNFNTLALLNEIFHERYSNRVESMAHFFRYHSIFQFVDEYKNELIKDDLVKETGGDIAMEPELIESLCVSPYTSDKKSENKRHAFSYAEVVKRAKDIRSARLN